MCFKITQTDVFTFILSANKSIVGRLYASVTYARQHDYNRTHYEKTGVNQKTQNKTKQNPKSGLYKWTGIDNNKCMNNDYYL